MKVNSHRTKRQSAFVTLARKLSGARTQVDAAAIIVQTAQDLFGWDACHLDLYDSDQDLVFPLLNIETIEGKQCDVTPLISAGPPTARGRRVIAGGPQLILRERPITFDVDSVSFGDRSRPSASIMSVPIRHSEEIVGMLSIHSYKIDAYTETDLKYLSALADHCGEAINRIRIEQSLRESEEHYRELFENSKDAIYVHNMSGIYTSVNRAAEELSGYSREEIIGRPFWKFVAPEYVKKAREYLCKKLEEVGETNYELELITKQGERVPVEVTSRIIYKENEPVGVQGTARDISERKRAQDALRIYSSRLIQAQETERHNIARELHDQIGQLLTAIKINLHTIQSTAETNRCRLHIEESMRIIDEAVSRVRELSLSLRPALLDDLGLDAALRWYVDQFAQRTGVKTELLNEMDNGRLSREVETACFRIAQEALTNIARHAHATKVTLQLRRLTSGLLVTIADDGVGFDVKEVQRQTSALGLRGMIERARVAKGTLKIDSKPQVGTHVAVFFRLKRA